MIENALKIIMGGRRAVVFNFLAYHVCIFYFSSSFIMSILYSLTKEFKNYAVEK